jgi:hypothetical protein
MAATAPSAEPGRMAQRVAAGSPVATTALLLEVVFAVPLWPVAAAATSYRVARGWYGLNCPKALFQSVGVSMYPIHERRMYHSRLMGGSRCRVRRALRSRWSSAERPHPIRNAVSVASSATHTGGAAAGALGATVTYLTAAPRCTRSRPVRPCLAHAAAVAAASEGVDGGL